MGIEKIIITTKRIYLKTFFLSLFMIGLTSCLILGVISHKLVVLGMILLGLWPIIVFGIVVLEAEDFIEINNAYKGDKYKVFEIIRTKK